MSLPIFQYIVLPAQCRVVSSLIFRLNQTGFIFSCPFQRASLSSCPCLTPYNYVHACQDASVSFHASLCIPSCMCASSSFSAALGNQLCVFTLPGLPAPGEQAVSCSPITSHSSHPDPHHCQEDNMSSSWVTVSGSTARSLLVEGGCACACAHVLCTYSHLFHLFQLYLTSCAC